jgi:hypothetical protein
MNQTKQRGYMKLTKQQLATLKKAAAILNSISDDLYDNLVDLGLQPSTAGLATGEIVSHIESLQSTK